MTLLESLARWLRGEGAPVDDLGTLVDETIDEVVYRVTGKLTRRGSRQLLWLELEATTPASEERRLQELPLVSADRLLDAMADVRRTMEAGATVREDPGARIAAALLRLPGLGLVHTWEGVDGATDADRGRRLDLHLAIAGDTGRHWLVFTGRGAGGGRWPPTVADALVARRDRLQPLPHRDV